MPREPVPASEFTRNFGRYRMLAQREPIPVSSHGEISGYFVRADQFEEFLKHQSRRRVLKPEDLDDETIELLSNARVDPRHDHLDALLDDEPAGE